MPDEEGVIEFRIPARDVVSIRKRGDCSVLTWRTGDGDPPTAAATKPDDYPEEFEELWTIFPKRSGTNSKREAFGAWRERRRESVPQSIMATAVSRYAEYIRATGKEGTEFVMQMATFLGPKKRGWETEWKAPKQEAGPYGIPALEGFGR